MSMSRRDFVSSAAAAIAVPAAAGGDGRPQTATMPIFAAGKGPIAIASANGVEACKRAVELMRQGTDPVEAAVAGVNLVEDDPKDHSVGYGGIPNEEGVVELDASVMDGRTAKAGAVAALRNIRNPSSVALKVMRRSDHVLLVGEGALRFARAHGFKEENILTDEAREIWLKWKESLSSKDDWLSDEEQKSREGAALPRRGQDMTPLIPGLKPGETLYGTINLCCMNAAGDIAGVTTTSGLAFKIPGRVGDSPIIGAGLFVDNAVGAAGSTGRGEANLQNVTSFLVVELMRAGRSPQEACLEALRRVADRCEPRLRNEAGEAGFSLSLYALRRDGLVGGATMRGQVAMTVHDGNECRHVPLPPLFG